LVKKVAALFADFIGVYFNLFSIYLQALICFAGCLGKYPKWRFQPMPLACRAMVSRETIVIYI